MLLRHTAVRHKTRFIKFLSFHAVEQADIPCSCQVRIALINHVPKCWKVWLYYWADASFRRLDGLRIGPGSIFDLYERDGKLWLLQDSGIYALDKARILAGETPHATQYGTARGLTGSLRVNTCNYMAPDGSLYLTTRNGVSVFDFREISAPMPPLVINSIRVDDRTYESPEQLTPGA